ncbi:hypothetical protein CEXT_677101 [Caerostris extrusa]|uniref:Uncharacterized protein n=1 Tax=Caerostris extrusa TaxID=172846 RepID=A0AAV4NJZ9_CAEEX|nr:hypothetical protein CEXT_677101 [Caerostris extrusa]
MGGTRGVVTIIVASLRFSSGPSDWNRLEFGGVFISHLIGLIFNIRSVPFGRENKVVGFCLSFTFRVMEYAIHTRANTISSCLFLKAISLVSQVRDLVLEHTIQKNITIIPKFSTELFHSYYILHGFFNNAVVVLSPSELICICVGSLSLEKSLNCGLGES